VWLAGVRPAAEAHFVRPQDSFTGMGGSQTGADIMAKNAVTSRVSGSRFAAHICTCAWLSFLPWIVWGCRQTDALATEPVIQVLRAVPFDKYCGPAPCSPILIYPLVATDRLAALDPSRARPVGRLARLPGDSVTLDHRVARFIQGELSSVSDSENVIVVVYVRGTGSSDSIPFGLEVMGRSVVHGALSLAVLGTAVRRGSHWVGILDSIIEN
jgi:hypothetical protein